MNKTQLINAISKDTNQTKADTERYLNSFVTTVKKTLKRGQEVRVTGFGRWYVSKRKARKGRNPQTGATIRIPARKVPAFRAGADLKKSCR
ncbi:HU family DNA-binding protein [Bdellovibrionota bacterium]